MDLLAKPDEEIFSIGKPFWENLVRSSNLKDYGSFTKDFSTQMLFGANEVELGKQWANNELITNLNETYEPFGTLRRGEHITILIKQTNSKIPGEFLGRMVLGVIKKPPPTPNKPESTPTIALNKSISTGLIKTCAIGKKTSI